MTTTAPDRRACCSRTTSRTTCARRCAPSSRSTARPTLVDGLLRRRRRRWRHPPGRPSPATSAWPRLLVPEDLGGAGASAREAAVVLEELGRCAAPVPFLTSAVAATATLVALGGDAAGTCSAGSPQGDETAALLVPATARSVTGHALDADGAALSGTVRNVVGVGGGVRADVLLVPVRSGDGVTLHAVPASDAGGTIADVVSLDMTRPLADVVLDGATATALSAEDATAAVDRGAAASPPDCSPPSRSASRRWCLETTVAYLKERKQFGRAVGGFQALKHRLADLYAEVESARAAARYAAATLADRRRGRRRWPSRVAQAYCADVAVHAAEEAVQLHGGIGMTWEHPAHLHLKRAKADQLLLGTPEQHRADLAALVDLPPGLSLASAAADHQRELQQQLVARVGQAAAGELLDLLHPVDHGVAVAVQLLGRVRGRPVVAQQRGQRLEQRARLWLRLAQDAVPASPRAAAARPAGCRRAAPRAAAPPPRPHAARRAAGSPPPGWRAGRPRAKPAMPSRDARHTHPAGCVRREQRHQPRLVGQRARQQPEVRPGAHVPPRLDPADGPAGPRPGRARRPASRRGAPRRTRSRRRRRCRARPGRRRRTPGRRPGPRAARRARCAAAAGPGGGAGRSRGGRSRSARRSARPGWTRRSWPP